MGTDCGINTYRNIRHQREGIHTRREWRSSFYTCNLCWLQINDRGEQGTWWALATWCDRAHSIQTRDFNTSWHMGHSGFVLLFLIGNRVGNLVQAGISNKKKISYTASVLPVEQLATAAARRGEACHRSILFRNFLLQDGSYTSYVYIISTRPQQLEQSISIDSDCSSSWSTFPFFWRRRLRPGLVRLSMGLHSSTTNGNLSHDDLLIGFLFWRRQRPPPQWQWQPRRRPLHTVLLVEFFLVTNFNFLYLSFEY